MNIQDLVKKIKKQQVVTKNVNELIPYAKNSRKHSEEQVVKIASSIKAFGFTNPILVTKDNEIIAGHGRVLAAQKLSLDTVPCIELDLSETEARAYVIADNQLALISEWDQELLSLEIEGLKAESFDIDLLGFGEVANFEFEPPAEKTLDGKKELVLRVEFEEEEEQQLLFSELRDRGYRVKV